MTGRASGAASGTSTRSWWQLAPRRGNRASHEDVIRTVLVLDTSAAGARRVAACASLAPRDARRLWRTVARFGLGPLFYFYCRQAGLLGALGDDRAAWLRREAEAN